MAYLVPDNRGGKRSDIIEFSVRFLVLYTPHPPILYFTASFCRSASVAPWQIACYSCLARHSRRKIVLPFFGCKGNLQRIKKNVRVKKERHRVFKKQITESMKKRIFDELLFLRLLHFFYFCACLYSSFLLL